jgi:hypothetical protein
LQEQGQRLAHDPLLPPVAVGLDKIQQQILNQLQHAVSLVVFVRVHAKVGGVAEVRHGDLGEELAPAGVCRDPFVAGVLVCLLAAQARLAAVAAVLVLVFLLCVVGFGEWRLAPADVRVRSGGVVPQLSVGRVNVG